MEPVAAEASAPGTASASAAATANAVPSLAGVLRMLFLVPGIGPILLRSAAARRCPPHDLRGELPTVGPFWSCAAAALDGHAHRGQAAAQIAMESWGR